jgi:hypothetical protein
VLQVVEKSLECNDFGKSHSPDNCLQLLEKLWEFGVRMMVMENRTLGLHDTQRLELVALPTRFRLADVQLEAPEGKGLSMAFPCHTFTSNAFPAPQGDRAFRNS